MNIDNAEKTILFDGTGLDQWENWMNPSDGPVDWDLKDWAMTVNPREKGGSSLISKEKFKDAFIHVEFRVPNMPDAEGQHKGNSGVFLQGLYEIQVLDSYGFDIPGTGDCGAFYEMHAPLVNACKAPEEWQTYDIIFRAPRFDENNAVCESARATVFHNDVIIHNNVILPTATGASKGKPIVAEGGLMLQDHGDLVSYRNIWLNHLPMKGSEEYEPR